MSKNQGIFEPQEGFASVPPVRSPFSIDETPNNPFAAAPASKSPFAVSEDDGGEKSAKASDKPSDPFASAEGRSPFSYENPVEGFGGSPFEGSPAPKAASDSAFAGTVETKPSATPPPFGDPSPAKEQAAAPAPAAVTPPAPAAPPAAIPTPQPHAASEDSYESDSSSIRQLELRAIFGVDRELSENEIIQRSKSLPGIRHLGRVAAEDAGAVDGIKRVLGNLGFAGGQVKLYCGSAPIEFVREGRVLLAVQTDGGFAPGVRETLMIVARELGRM